MKREQGQVTVLVLGLALVAIAVSGLAVDGTRAFLFRRSLQNAADSAALAAASEIDREAYYASGGRGVVLDQAAAASSARRWLARRGLPLRVAVSTSTERIRIEVRGQLRTSFLGLVGIPSLNVAAAAEAAPISGVPPPR